MRVLANLRCGAYPCVMLYSMADYRMVGTGTGRLNSGISPRWNEVGVFNASVGKFLTRFCSRPFAYPRAGTRRPVRAEGYFARNGWTSQGQEGCWYESQNGTGRSDSRAMLFAGSPSTGKTAIASLISSVPCFALNTQHRWRRRWVQMYPSP